MSWTHRKIEGFCQKLRYNYLHWIIRVRPPNIFCEGNQWECNYHTGKHSGETTGSYSNVGTGVGLRCSENSQLSTVSKMTVIKSFYGVELHGPLCTQLYRRNPPEQNSPSSVYYSRKNKTYLQDTSSHECRIYKVSEGSRNRPEHFELHMVNPTCVIKV